MSEEDRGGHLNKRCRGTGLLFLPEMQETRISGTVNSDLDGSTLQKNSASPKGKSKVYLIIWTVRVYSNIYYTIHKIFIHEIHFDLMLPLVRCFICSVPVIQINKYFRGDTCLKERR